MVGLDDLRGLFQPVILCHLLIHGEIGSFIQMLKEYGCNTPP